MYCYDEFMQTKTFDNTSYIRIYKSGSKYLMKKYNNVLINIFNIIYNCNLNLSFIIETKLIFYTPLLADMIYVLSYFFKKTYIIKHKYNKKDRFQIILYNKINHSKKKTLLLKNKSYVSRLLPTYDDKIFTHFTNLINNNKKQVATEFAMVKLQKHRKLHDILMEKIRTHKMYIEFNAQSL